MLPEQSFAEKCRERELSRWKGENDLVKRVVESIEELQKIFPQDSIYGPVEKREGKSNRYTVYARPLKTSDQIVGKGLDQQVAYDCPSCKNIVIGPPRIEAVSHEAPLAGREGMDTSCSFCYASLDSVTFSMN